MPEGWQEASSILKIHKYQAQQPSTQYLCTPALNAKCSLQFNKNRSLSGLNMQTTWQLENLQVAEKQCFNYLTATIISNKMVGILYRVSVSFSFGHYWCTELDTVKLYYRYIKICHFWTYVEYLLDYATDNQSWTAVNLSPNKSKFIIFIELHTVN